MRAFLALLLLSFGVLVVGPARAVGNINGSLSALSVPASWCVVTVSAPNNTFTNDCPQQGVQTTIAAAVAAKLPDLIAAFNATNPTHPLTCGAPGGGSRSYSSQTVNTQTLCTWDNAGTPVNANQVIGLNAHCNTDPSTGTHPSPTGSVETYNCATHGVVCPGGSTLNGSGTCTCNAGTRAGLSTTTCSPYTCAGGTDSTINNYQYPAGTAVPATAYFCNTRGGTVTEGCGIAFTPSIKAQDSSTGNTFVWGSGVVTGAKCEGGAAGTGTTPNLPTAATTPASGVSTATTNTSALPNNATTCPAGNLPIVVGGVPTCSTAGTVSTVEGSNTVTAPSGSASAPAGTVIGTTQTETQCSNGVCRQVTTTYDTTGQPIAVNTGGSQSAGDLCKANPTSKTCSGGSTGGGGGDGSGAGFSGTCSAGFVCTGGEDAVTCAIAVEQHRRDCQFALSFGDGTTNTLTTKGEAMAAAGDLGDTDHPRRPANITTLDLSGGFTMTDDIGHAACVPDRTIGPIVLPLSRLCAPADIAGQVLLLFTSIWCVMTVLGRRS